MVTVTVHAVRAHVMLRVWFVFGLFVPHVTFRGAWPKAVTVVSSCHISSPDLLSSNQISLADSAASRHVFQYCCTPCSIFCSPSLLMTSPDPPHD